MFTFLVFRYVSQIVVYVITIMFRLLARPAIEIDNHPNHEHYWKDAIWGGEEVGGTDFEIVVSLKGSEADLWWCK